jgi:hypothetical protein
MRIRATMIMAAAFGLAALAVPGRLLACEAATHLAYNQPVELEGTLKTGKGQHDAQGPFDYTYLALDKPICVDAAKDDEFNESTESPVERIQIAGDAISKDLPIGSRATVKGTLFGAHTMWHVEPVLIDAADVAAK